MYNQKIEYESEKTQSNILTNQIKEDALKNNILQNTINDIEDKLFDQKLKYVELLEKFEEVKIQNKNLQKSLNIEEDKVLKNYTFITALEKELKIANDKSLSETVHVIDIEPINKLEENEPKNTLSLYDEINILENEPKNTSSSYHEINELNQILKYKKYIEDLQSHIKYLNRFYKRYTWFYRGISVIYISTIIYCITEIV